MGTHCLNWDGRSQVIKTSEGNFILDIVAYSTEKVVEIECQVVNNQISLQSAHNNKVNKYEFPFSTIFGNLCPNGVFFMSR